MDTEGRFSDIDTSGEYLTADEETIPSLPDVDMSDESYTATSGETCVLSMEDSIPSVTAVAEQNEQPRVDFDFPPTPVSLTNALYSAQVAD
jgi:hypothetical protein